MNNCKNLAILILAAGTSSRLGEPKQLLKYKRKSLLQIAVQKALSISKDVFVVLGYKEEKCKKEIEKFNVNILSNMDYKKGMSTSILVGINHTKDFENTMIILCDQPFIPTSHLLSMKNMINNKNIITSYYHNLTIIPAIFPKIYYNELLNLKGDKGAKEIIKNEQVISVRLDEKLALDIDTIEDKMLIYKN